ncbi:hypothetical protein [Limibacillus sp. MBR-115]|jgi:hypothetical protein|uniref:hypothetical protein n=1 Tax=Limibacillus sp. MBR-115 TaxID=3156465 RepID=UPI003398244D
MMKWRRYPKKLRAYLKKHKRALIRSSLAGLLAGMLATDGFGKLLIIWYHLTDDGYGSYLPPDEIDPAPVASWPPILGPEVFGVTETSTVAGGVQTLPRLTRSDLKRFFFPKGFEDDITLYYPERIGLVTRRFDRRPVGIWDASSDSDADLDVLNFYNRIREAVPALPEAYLALGDATPPGNPETNAEISVYSALKQWKPKHRVGVWRPDGEIGKRMIAQGCGAYPDFYFTELAWTGKGAMSPAQKYRVHRGRIGIFHRLGEPTVEHCLFRALMVTLGLHPTEAFFFKEGPVPPEEQAKALAALKLLYHPAITPGLDEWHFVQTLLNRNMIDP